MHRTILAAVTPDGAGRDALTLAVELARPFGTQVVLVGVVGQDAGPPKREGEWDEVLRGLHALRDAGPHDVPLSVDAVRSPSLMRGLHELAVEHEAQVLVLGPAHGGVIGRALHGDHAADAVFTAPCAVAVATARIAARPLARVGVAWDGTTEADEALEWAVQFAERTAASLEIVRVLDPRHREGAALQTRVAERLAGVREAAEQRVRAAARLIGGHAAPALVEASHHLDLLVLGSRAQGSLRRTLLGSTSTAVLRWSRCPIVVLPRCPGRYRRNLMMLRDVDTARVGDWIEEPEAGGHPPRRGLILEVLGRPGHRHFTVRWDEEHTSIHFPSEGAPVHHDKEQRQAHRGPTRDGHTAHAARGGRGVLVPAPHRGVPRVWLHRGLGPGSSSDAAVASCKAHDIMVIPEACPNMFGATSDSGHRCMLHVLQLSTKMPRTI